MTFYLEIMDLIRMRNTNFIERNEIQLIKCENEDLFKNFRCGNTKDNQRMATNRLTLYEIQ